MNKWKIAFWICLLSGGICTLLVFLSFSKKDMESGFIKDANQAYNRDLDKLIIIFNKDLKTKKQIEAEFSVNGYSPFLDINGDTASLFRSDLIFRNDTLVKIIGRDN